MVIGSIFGLLAIEIANVHPEHSFSGGLAFLLCLILAGAGLMLIGKGDSQRAPLPKDPEEPGHWDA